MRQTVDWEFLRARSIWDGECLRWQGSKNHKGYGSVSVNGRQARVHRYAYELKVGPIPEGLEIDHVRARGCRFRDCLNPAHLEAVTHHENILRSPATNPSHCPHGHEYTEENSVYSTHTYRRCAQCLYRRVICECGEEVTARNLVRHQQRRRHIAAMTRGAA